MEKKPFLIMGVVNLTPDSFSDGGSFTNFDAAYKHSQTLIEQGTDILDIGAESTRPGAQAVDVETEWSRLEPLLKKLQDRPAGVRVSVDTYKPEVMRRACELGVDFINDINGAIEGPYLSELSSEFPALSYIAMHKNGTPSDMQKHPLTDVAPVADFFAETATRLKGHGFNSENIWLDPGIGFGKTDQLNWQLLNSCTQMTKTHNVVIGISRKSFIGRWLGIENPSDRDQASKALEAGLVMAGVKMIRTHVPGPLLELRKMLQGYVH